MAINEDVVLKVLALAVGYGTPTPRLRYLLKKLYGLDGLTLDANNIQTYNKLKEVSTELDSWYKVKKHQMART